jgi:hypothetical protein
MNTDQLIVSLTGDVAPVSRHSVGRRLALGVTAGAMISLLVTAFVIGVRPDLGTAIFQFSFWMKWGYTASISVAAIFATARLARPDPGNLRRLWLLALPIGLLLLVGIDELVRTPPGEWLAMWLGHSWKRCPWLVLILSAPIFIGLLWSFRRLAPTRLRAAGAAAGLAAGAFAATVYCLHCGEVSAIFVLTWYSLGILLAASIGALIGPKVLRW